MVVLEERPFCWYTLYTDFSRYRIWNYCLSLTTVEKDVGYTMKNRLCITPCGAAKIWDRHPERGGVPAKEAYISAFGVACHTYADTFFDHWIILSAKHGFLFPTDIVPENYDLAFNSGSPDIITTEALKQQAKEKGLNTFDEIFVVAGQKHIKVVREVFGTDCTYRFPLQGCKGIGYMLQKLKKAVQENKEIDHA